MDIRNPAGLLDSLLYTNTQNAKKQGQSFPETIAAAKKQTTTKTTGSRDLVTLQEQEKPAAPPLKTPPRPSGLVSEETINVENGFRRTQQFDRGEGRSFTRIEEVTNTSDRSKRVVIQQNSSGSTTALEKILDRQADGSFRLTQRYTNEIGETSTNIEFDITPNNADIILGRAPSPEQQNQAPFEKPRGTQFDVVA